MSALRNRQRKAWAMARVLATFPNIGDPDLASVDGAIREQVARAAGNRTGRPVSQWTWRLSVAHARRLAGVRHERCDTCGAEDHEGGNELCYMGGCPGAMVAP